MKLIFCQKAAVLSFLALIIFQNSAFAAGPTCQDIFSKTAPINHRAIDKAKLRAEVSKAFAEQYQVATDTPNLIARMITWNASRRAKLNSQYRESEVRRSVARADFQMSLLARVVSGDAQFLRTPEERWFQREVMSKSLMEIAAQNGLDPQRSSSIFRKIMRNRALGFLVNPLRMPEVSDHAIPDALFQKILIDGPEKHYYELRNAFQTTNQSTLNRYRNFARIYRLVSTVVVMYFAADYFLPSPEERRERQLEKLDADLDGLNDFLNHLDQELEKADLLPAEQANP